MKTALVCIAKDEDHYLEEWVDYHLKLGFDDIFIHQNNWRWNGAAFPSNVHLIELDGNAMQLQAYNTFIDQHHHEYDFAAFWDCDEFLCLKQKSNVKDFLCEYTDIPAIGINWRCFGDNGLKRVMNGDYSLVKRFTMCEKSLNKHIKTIINFNVLRNLAHFINPHFVDLAWNNDICVNVERTHWIHGPFNQLDLNSNIAQLNHYYSKTCEEFQHKLIRGKPDFPPSHPNYNYKADDFYLHNENDVEDLTAKKFFNENT